MEFTTAVDDAHHRKPVAKAAPPVAASSFTPNVFAASTVLAVALFRWPLRWIVSGVPILVYTILLGQAKGCRVLPYIPLWSIFTTLNLLYAVAATSWLLYWVFAFFCYVSILFSCMFQFDMAAMLARRAFRSLLRDLHFINDTISFFNLPALEIDTEVNGLLVIRGFTFSLSTLTGTAHGIEVGIKLSDDMELAIQTEKCTVHLFRKITIGDVFCNVKGGEWEMSFGSLKPGPRATLEDDFVSKDTPILKAAAEAALMDGSRDMKDEFTYGEVPKDQSAKESKESIQKLTPDEEKARGIYEAKLRRIHETSTINIAIERLKKDAEEDEEKSSPVTDANIRAAVCTHIHNQPTIPHPPKTSIRVSTLMQTSYPGLKKFIHRLPFLYRCLLSPISYFHPVHIENITCAGSGKWMVSLMQHHLFKHFPSQDGVIRRLEARISAWLADANFAVELGGIKCTAHVPIDSSYDIETHFAIRDLMAFRTLLPPSAVNLIQVVRLGGADATLSLPSFLLPRHEHLLPPKPTIDQTLDLEQEISDADGIPNTVQKQRELDQLQKDETNMKISAHAHLPAVFDQQLLNFVAALVKATRIIEMEKDHEDMVLKRAETLEFEESLFRTDSIASDSASIASTDTGDTVGSIGSTTSTMRPKGTEGFNKFMRKMDRGFKDMNTNVKDGMRKAGINTVSAVANDRWIAKIVGNIMRKLEKAQGDVGYSGLIPIELAYYRDRAEYDYSKLLP
jgi:hypothetical protein